MKLLIFLLFFCFCDASCPQLCNGQGTCGAYNKCSCFTGFTGADCSEKTCPTGKPWVDYATADDVARSTDVECSNMGLCDTFTGECVCPVGFEGPACERKSCPNNCNGHGQCLSMSEAAIEQDDRTLFATTTYTSIWDAEKIYGCVCDLGYTGADCSLRTCPVGDDPMTTGQVDEVQAISCLCNGCSGTFTVTFRGETTAPIETTATAATVEATLEALRTIDDITVAFDGGSTICDTDGVSAMITFTQNPGNLPNLIITSSLTGGSSAVSVESDGSTAAYGSTPATVTGTKENVECSGRGTCDTSTGTCTCTTGFASSNGAGGTGTLGECGYNSATVTACPLVSAVACNGKGTCSGSSEYKCTCYEGWSSFDCSKRDCPSGRVWWGDVTAVDTSHVATAICSNAGLCDYSSGTCSCFSGYSGTACDRIDCPSVCSGHGQCKSMAELASLGETNGVQNSFTYGTNPNSVATWDANMIFGCHCDKVRLAYGQVLQYSGFDCSKEPCPSGDDPWTTGQVDEKQTISCTADGGTFTLTFRGETTAALSYSASAAAVEAALEGLFTIGQVTVTYQSSATEACTTGGTNIDVVFNSNAGDLPLLTISSSSLTHGTAVSTNVVQVDQGTKENALCNDRGLCDTSSGQCRCIYDFASSNGMGSLGVRHDCGYLDEFMTHGELGVPSIQFRMEQEGPAFIYKTCLVVMNKETSEVEDFVRRNDLPGCDCRNDSCDDDCSCLYGSATSAYTYREDGTQVLRLGPQYPSIFECNSNCSCTPASCRMRFVQHSSFNIPVRTVWNSHKGWSVYTETFIPPGAFICEYMGELISTTEAKRRYGGVMNYILAVRESVKDRIYCTNIDATRYGNISRLFNHSCDPSLQLESVRIDSLVPHLVFFASKALNPGDELTFDYAGQAVDPELSGQKCFCETRSCRGFLPQDRHLT